MNQQLTENYLLMLEAQQMLDEGRLDDLKGWTKNKLQPLAKNMLQAIKKKDIKALERIKRVIPSMGLGKIEEIGKKFSDDYSSLTSKVEKTIKQKTKGKANKQKSKALANLVVLSAITTSKNQNPDKKVNQYLAKMKALEDTDEREERDIGAVDVIQWIVSAALGVVGTIVVAQMTGVLFIFGPLILFAMFNAIFYLMRGIEIEED